MKARLRFLNLEDNRNDAELNEAALAAEGIDCETVCVETREDFLAAIQQTGFDIILADYSLPAFDGLAALELAREWCPEVPFIFVSGTLGEEIAIEALKNGATDYVLKDRLSQLAPAVRRALRGIEEGLARKRAEAALLESENKFKSFAEQAPAGIYMIQDGVFRYVNPTFAEMFGYSVEECLNNLPFQQLVYPDDVPLVNRQVAKRTSGEAKSVQYIFRGMKKNGEVIDVEIYGSSITHDGRPAALGTILDITERRRADEEKQKLEAQLRQSHKMEAIGTLAGGIAHDFNNILAAVLGFAEMAHDDALHGRVNPSDLEQIMASAHRAKDLVRQILAFSRKSEPALKPLSLNQVIQRTLAVLERTLPKMVRIETRLAANLPPVQADATQMEQVLLNLAGNAQDAMPEGGGLTFETREIFLDHDYCRRHLEVLPGPYVQLMVTDTGVGVDENTREHIFEPFFTTKEVGKGTGLGLASVYGIVKSHRGYIHCNSEPGLGTTFKIYLPVFQERDSSHWTEPSPIRHEGLTGTETILLVDDEEALRELGARALSSRGYQVLTAGSGEEALEIYQNQEGRLDLVILDLGMPGMGGHKCLKEILALNPQARVVIASGYSAGDQVKAAVQSGAAGYVAKPFQRTDLLTMVRSVLDKEWPGILESEAIKAEAR
jgi:PAS domain S-box-containing protein